MRKDYRQACARLIAKNGWSILSGSWSMKYAPLLAISLPCVTMKSKSSFGQMFLRYKLHHILFWIVYFIFWLSIYFKSYPFPLLLVNTTLYAVFTAASFYLII